MVATIFDIIVDMCFNFFRWLESLMNAVGGMPYYVTAIMVFMSYKYLLKPVFGMAGSDLARRSRNQKKEGD